MNKKVNTKRIHQNTKKTKKTESLEKKHIPTYIMATYGKCMQMMHMGAAVSTTNL